jgi:alcohol dehydrogenase (NADP+)
MPLNRKTGHMPALGFGALIPDAATTINAPEKHWRAKRYRNEREVGEPCRQDLPLEELRVMKSIAFKPDRASMK